jgi:hypothetical protein
MFLGCFGMFLGCFWHDLGMFLGLIWDSLSFAWSLKYHILGPITNGQAPHSIFDFFSFQLSPWKALRAGGVQGES